MKTANDKSIAYTAVGFMILSAVLTLVVIGSVSLLREQLPFVRKNCSEVSSYEEAQDQLARGNKRLDGNKDGRPCEARFNLLKQIRGRIIAL